MSDSRAVEAHRDEQGNLVPVHPQHVAAYDRQSGKLLIYAGGPSFRDAAWEVVVAVLAGEPIEVDCGSDEAGRLVMRLAAEMLEEIEEAAMLRNVFRVMWSEGTHSWRIFQDRGRRNVYKPHRTRFMAIRAARRLARRAAPSELIIHRKDGSIGTGPSSRSTYGADPEESKG